ncbi:FAD-dependent oxidoreductase [Rhizobium vallis]|uniref:FAD-dependent oxidoreductase n=1 Tax=Rhizobium vallis TaxID=634290 RepID=A0A3S0QR52_9HYPH|nr:FAD-dependent oxidoreductase [Rhizobium vallis]RUM20491.1 FAD-dependent oxidoreductase [Rhizobium vallis]
MELVSAVPANIPSELSWWQQDVRSSFTIKNLPPLSGNIEVDVLIVGGGFTGMWTALTLKKREPSLRIAIVDAYRCGDGASARNGGNVHGYWGALPTLLPMYGAQKSLEAAELGTLAQRKLRHFAETHDVWWTEEGYLRVATSAAQRSKLNDFMKVAETLGFPSSVRRLSKSNLSELCNSPRFEEGLLFEEGATVHPARLAHFLREEVISAGVQVYEDTPVLRVSKGEPCQVNTARGGVTARDVVLATYTGTMSVPSVYKATTLFSSFPVMSNANELELERLNYRVARGIADLRMFTHYFRRTRDGRILMGSGSGPIAIGGKHSASDLRSDQRSADRAAIGLQRFFPSIAKAGIAARWGFPIEVTSDRLPYFGTISGSRIHYGSGYSGHGVNATVIAGECLASIILRTADRWSTSPFCKRDRLRFPPEPFRFVGGALIRNAIVTCEDAQDAGLRQPLIARGIADIPRMIGMRIGTR